MKKLFFAGLALAVIMSLMGGHAAYAATPEACFGFDSATGSITDYYDNENDDVSNPACSRDVDIPALIAGVPVREIQPCDVGGSTRRLSKMGGAFCDAGLTSITIPGSVTSIGNGAFDLQSSSPTFTDDYFSRDPIKFQAALDSIIIVKLYTTNSGNPAGLKDSVSVVDEAIGQDYGYDATNPYPTT